MSTELASILLAELRADPTVLAELRTLLGAAPSVYTPKTLAAELGITPRAVRAAIERGDLHARRSGRGYVIGAEAVAEWASSPPRTRRPRVARESRPLGDALAELADRGFERARVDR
jgi:excisionase family DNA binding protein